MRFVSASSSETIAVGFGSIPAPTSVSDPLGKDLTCQFVDETLQMGIDSLPVIREIRASGSTLSANLTGFSAGATVILQTSTNLRDWTEVRRFTASSGSISIQHPIQPNATGEYLRFLLR